MMQILCQLAMAVLVLGTLPSIVSAIKNKQSLSGFSMLGAFCFVFSEILWFAYFWSIGDWLSILEGIPVITFWIIVIAYKFGQRSYRKRMLMKCVASGDVVYGSGESGDSKREDTRTEVCC